MEELLQVGILSSTHGVKGEMKVFPTTDDPNRFKKNKHYILMNHGKQMSVEVESVKFFKQFVILKFKGFESLDEILPYKGCALFVTRSNAIKCQKDEYFIADLIGVEVYDEENNMLGTISDVIQTGANDVYVVTDDKGNEKLIPAIKQCVKDIQIDANKMTIHIMPGLFD